MRQLSGSSPYQLIISGVHLVAEDNFSLLKRIQEFQPTVPLVVTAGASEQASARQALDLGAFGIIPNVEDAKDTVSMVRFGLWQNQLLAMIASQEKAHDKYRQHLAAYPAHEHKEELFKNNLLIMEKAFESFEETLDQIDETLKFFTCIAHDTEKQAQHRSLEHLRSLIHRQGT